MSAGRVMLSGCRLSLPARFEGLAIDDAVLVSSAGAGDVVRAWPRIGMARPRALQPLALTASVPQQAAVVREIFAGGYMPSVTYPRPHTWPAAPAPRVRATIVLTRLRADARLPCAQPPKAFSPV